MSHLEGLIIVGAVVEVPVVVLSIDDYDSGAVTKVSSHKLQMLAVLEARSALE